MARTLRLIMTTSAIFIATRIVLLLILSAKTPAAEEKSKKGTTKTAPAVAKIEGADDGPWIRMIKKIMRSLNTLSFKAPKNWVAFRAYKDLESERKT